MICRWDSSDASKMILSGILTALILIRHAVGFYHDDYGPKWPLGVKQQQQRDHYSRSAHIAISLPHPHRHHHEYMHKPNREMHIKSQYSHYNHNRDHRVGRPATKAITTTARSFLPALNIHSVAGKWSSTTAASMKWPYIRHISHSDGNETIAGSTSFRNGEKPEMRANDKQIVSGAIRHNINSDLSPSSSFSKASSNHMDRSLLNHRKEQNENHRHGTESNHRTFLESKSRIVHVDPVKISRLDHEIKTITDNGDDYDDYYDADEESDDLTAANKLEETKSPQDTVEDFNFDYLEDEPNTQNDNNDQDSLRTESFTVEKWKNYGTAEAVEKSRRRYNNEGQSAATAHIQRIKEESRCRWPHPKVIPVIEASKRFVPHCTILHRCGDDTGCCEYDTKTCVAKSTSTVHLHFYVIPLGGSASVEVRSFVNHTECHCVDRCVSSSCADNRGMGIANYSGVVASEILNANETCQCPTHFDAIQEEFVRGRCRCDCLNNSQACYILKRGQDGFPSEDQKCVLDEKCQMPTCQYGRYNKYSGRCPRVKHQKRTISGYDYR